MANLSIVDMMSRTGTRAMAEGKRHGKRWKPGGTPGKLHREIGVPEGQKIPAARLEAASHSKNPEIRRDAIRAKTMKKWHHGKSKLYDGSRAKMEG